MRPDFRQSPSNRFMRVLAGVSAMLSGGRMPQPAPGEEVKLDVGPAAEPKPARTYRPAHPPTAKLRMAWGKRL